MKISDLSGLFKTDTYALRRSYQAEDGCTVFELKSLQNTQWIPGQHGIFSVPGAKFKGSKIRPFSIASVTEEGTILLATKISDTPSNFKAIWRDLQPGALIQMRGPIGWFYLQDDTSPVVMVAGGVGITPIRALFKELEKGNERNVTLIYSARESYLFKDELDTIAAHDPKISIVYTHSRRYPSSAQKRTKQQWFSSSLFHLWSATDDHWYQ